MKEKTANGRSFQSRHLLCALPLCYTCQVVYNVASTPLNELNNACLICFFLFIFILIFGSDGDKKIVLRTEARLFAFMCLLLTGSLALKRDHGGTAQQS